MIGCNPRIEFARPSMIYCSTDLQQAHHGEDSYHITEFEAQYYQFFF